MTEFPSQFR